jgi:ABC-type Zn uptake system ZnuABC Zn-binding protein ZnuA
VRSVHRFISSSAVVVGLALAVAGLTACGDDDGSAAGFTDGKLAVVATTSVLADFVQVVGGDRVSVYQVLKPNVDAHDFEPTPKDIEALRGATVVIKNGVELETWLDDALKASATKATVIDTSEGVTLREGEHEHDHAETKPAAPVAASPTTLATATATPPAAATPTTTPPAATPTTKAHNHDHDHDHDHGATKTTEKAAPATTAAGAASPTTAATATTLAAATPAKADDHDHDHGEHDPHIWHDPRNAKVMVDNVTKALSAADPAGAATFQANATAYKAKLDALDKEIEGKVAALANKKVVTNHEAFGYFLDRYGLTFVGAVIPSFDSATEVSAADVDALVKAVKAEGVKAIFTESTLPSKVAQTVAKEAGVKVVEGGDALYGDGLGTKSSKAGSYLDMMRHNTDTLVKNLA